MPRMSGTKLVFSWIGLALAGSADRIAAGPETGAAHFVRICLAGYVIGQVRDAAWMSWCRSPGESGHREIEAAPEKMNGARLAEERSLELLQRAIGREQHTMKAPHVFRIVSLMHVVFRERNRIRNFVRTAADGDVQAQITESMEQAGVKCSDRLGLQRQCACRPTAGADD